jgi:hypothetical protein
MTGLLGVSLFLVFNGIVFWLAGLVPKKREDQEGIPPIFRWYSPGEIFIPFAPIMLGLGLIGLLLSGLDALFGS